MSERKDHEGVSPAEDTPPGVVDKPFDEGKRNKKKQKKQAKQGKKPGFRSSRRKMKRRAGNPPRVHHPIKQHVKKVFTIPGTVSPPLTMFGWSRAMSGTGFFIPELKWMLDAGLSNLPQATHIFLTHGHQDHSLCLSGCALGAWVSHKIPPQLFCPSSLHGYVTRYVRAGLEMNLHSFITNESARLHGCPPPYVDRDFPWPWDLHPCDQADEPKDLGMNGMIMEVFRCDHSVPTVGYGFFSQTKKLREEFLKLPGQEIGRLRRANTPNMFRNMKHPKFAFMGDTSIHAFDDGVNPGLLDYPCIIIECTFLYPDHLEAAVSRKHVHWDQLRPIVVAHPKTTFVLIHFSNRYSDGEVLAFFADMDDRPANIEVWVPTEDESVELVQSHARYRDPRRVPGAPQPTAAKPSVAEADASEGATQEVGTGGSGTGSASAAGASGCS